MILMKSKTLKKQRQNDHHAFSPRHLLGYFADFVAVGHHVLVGSDGCGDQQACSTCYQRLDSSGFSEFLLNHQSPVLVLVSTQNRSLTWKNKVKWNLSSACPPRMPGYSQSASNPSKLYLWRKLRMKNIVPVVRFPSSTVLDRVKDEFTAFLLVMNHRGERV